MIRAQRTSIARCRGVTLIELVVAVAIVAIIASLAIPSYSGYAARSKRAAWSYEVPRASMTKVDHWIGFWNDVEIK